MIRVSATFLIAVQALLPPGMCFCQFVHSEPVASRHAHEPAPPRPAAVAAHVDEACCSCPACRAAAPAAPVAHDRAPTHREAPQKDHPPPTPSAPCSGCPVVAAGPVGRVAILAVIELAPLDLAVQFVVSPVETAARRDDRPDRYPPSASAPLFVRHCALLI